NVEPACAPDTVGRVVRSNLIEVMLSEPAVKVSWFPLVLCAVSAVLVGFDPVTKPGKMSELVANVSSAASFTVSDTAPTTLGPAPSLIVIVRDAEEVSPSPSLALSVNDTDGKVPLSRL